MALTNEELESNLKSNIDSVKHDFKESHDEVISRLDRMDLNGAAPGLRDFGYWLVENPGVFERMRKFEDLREERSIAFSYFRRVLHLDHIAGRLKWVIIGLATGVFLSLGGPITERMFTLLKALQHTIAGH